MTRDEKAALAAYFVSLATLLVIVVTECGGASPTELAWLLYLVTGG